MWGRGRWVLSFVVACALIGVLAPAAGAHHGATQRSSDFDRGWKFALANRTDITDPTGAYAHAADPGYDDGPWRDGRPPARLEHRARPDPRGHEQRDRLPAGRPGLVPQDLHAAALGGAQERLAGVRRHLHGLRRLPQRQAGRQPSLRLHRLRRRPRRTPTPTATRRTSSPSQVRNKLPSSRWYSGSGIYRNVHLVVTDPVARRAPRDVRDHARRREHLQEGLRERARRSPTSRGARARPASSPASRTPAGAPSRAARPAATAGGSAESDLRLSHPHLWSTDDPYLYTLKTEVRAGPRVGRPHRDDLRRALVSLRSRSRASRSTGAR